MEELKKNTKVYQPIETKIKAFLWASKRTGKNGYYTKLEEDYSNLVTPEQKTNFFKKYFYDDERSEAYPVAEQKQREFLDTLEGKNEYIKRYHTRKIYQRKSVRQNEVEEKEQVKEMPFELKLLLCFLLFLIIKILTD